MIRWTVLSKRRGVATGHGKQVALYNTAKRVANRAVHHAKSEAEKVVLEDIDTKTADIYKLAEQMHRENQGYMGEKPVSNDAGSLSLDQKGMETAI